MGEWKSKNRLMDILFVQLEMSVKKSSRSTSKTKDKCKNMVD